MIKLKDFLVESPLDKKAVKASKMKLMKKEAGLRKSMFGMQQAILKDANPTNVQLSKEIGRMYKKNITSFMKEVERIYKKVK